MLLPLFQCLRGSVCVVQAQRDVSHIPVSYIYPGFGHPCPEIPSGDSGRAGRGRRRSSFGGVVVPRCGQDAEQMRCLVGSGSGPWTMRGLRWCPACPGPSAPPSPGLHAPHSYGPGCLITEGARLPSAGLSCCPSLPRHRCC